MVVDWNIYVVVVNFYIKVGFVDKVIDVLKKVEVRLDNKDSIGYNYLIFLNVKLGKKDEILRLWEFEKIVCKRCLNRDFVNVLEFLVKIGVIEEVENVLKDWELFDNCYIFKVLNIVIVGFLDKGLFEKVEEMFEVLLEKGKDFSLNIWGLLVVGYLEKGEM